MDFELRGPGDLFGTQQHGLPPLRIADLRRDQAILEEARREAKQLFAADPGPQASRSRPAAAADARAVRQCARAGDVVRRRVALDRS